MRKYLPIVLLVMVLSLCGCSVLLDDSLNDNIETLKGWSFQYNSGTNDYSLFFGLLNEKDNYISAEVDVDIRIVNDKDEEVYSATKKVFQKDFGYYESQVAGEQYLANVRISADDIMKGKSNSGTVYLTVYKDDMVYFDEVNCSALYCLPVADVQLKTPSVPVELKVNGYDGSMESIIKVTEIQYVYEKDYFPQIKITILGEKTYGKSNSSYDIISYKLYDSDGYLVDASNIYLSSLDSGDKFKDDSIIILDVVPGETYVLELLEYSW